MISYNVDSVITYHFINAGLSLRRLFYKVNIYRPFSLMEPFPVVYVMMRRYEFFILFVLIASLLFPLAYYHVPTSCEWDPVRNDDETISGDDRGIASDNIVLEFPNGGGSHSNVTFEVPRNSYVVNASMSLQGLPVTRHVQWIDDSIDDFNQGVAQNVSISDVLELEQYHSEIATPGNWGGALFHNTTMDEGKVSLDRTGVKDFFTERRVDANGAFGDDEPHGLDMVSSSNGTLHLVYVSSAGGACYVRSFNRGIDWSAPLSLYDPVMSMGHISLFISPDDVLHFLTKEIMMGGSSLVHKVSYDNGSTWGEGTLGTSGIVARDITLVWDGNGIIHGLGSISFLFPPFDTFLRYFYSHDNGTSWSSTYDINDSSDAKPPSSEYDMAVDSTGRIHVVWADHRDFGWSAPQIYYTNFTQGTNHPPNRALDVLPDIVMKSPRIRAGPDDKLHIVWSDNRSGSGDIIYTNSSNGGLSFSTTRIVNLDRTGDQIEPEIEIFDDGELHLVWQDSGSGDFDIYYGNTTDYGQFTPQVRINTENSGEQRYPVIALSPDGAPAIAWNDGRAAPHRIYATSQVAPYCPEGTITGVFDPGLDPASFHMFSADMEVPQGTNIHFAVRTSPDNAAWSEWENVSLPGVPVTAPPHRYVEWELGLTTADDLISPAITSLALNYTLFKTEGSYRSSLKTTDPREAEYRLDWNGSMNGGDVVGYLSTDEGATWMGVENGQLVDLSTAGLTYRLDLSGTTAASPLVSTVTLNRTSLHLPSNISVDIGNDGGTDISYPGSFSGSEDVTFVRELQGNIDSAPPGSGNLTFEFEISSDSAGRIMVGDALILLDGRPEILNATPPEDMVEVYENETLLLDVNASDPDDIALAYQWTVDGTAVSDEQHFAYAPGFHDEGLHMIRVNISDTHSQVNHSWQANVLNTNRPPAVVTRQPIGPMSLELGETCEFKVTTRDPDNDTMTYNWKLDGNPIGSNSELLSLNTTLLEGTGNYTLTVLVSDGELWANAPWEVEIYEYAAGLSLTPSDLVIGSGSTGEIKIKLTNSGSRTTLYTLIYKPGELGATDKVILDGFSLRPGQFYEFGMNISVPVDRSLGSYTPRIVAVMSANDRVLADEVINIRVVKGDPGGKGHDEEEKESGGGALIWVLLVLFLLLVIGGIAAFVVVRGRKRGTDGNGATPDSSVEAKVNDAEGPGASEPHSSTVELDVVPVESRMEMEVAGEPLPPLGDGMRGGVPPSGGTDVQAPPPAGASVPEAPVCTKCGRTSTSYPEHDCWWCENCGDYVIPA